MRTRSLVVEFSVANAAARVRVPAGAFTDLYMHRQEVLKQNKLSAVGAYSVFTMHRLAVLRHFVICTDFWPFVLQRLI